jgi:hypothetical protein
LSSPIEEGYNDTSITDDMIQEVYMAFVERPHSEESDEYLRNLSPGTSCILIKWVFIDISSLRNLSQCQQHIQGGWKGYCGGLIQSPQQIGEEYSQLLKRRQ